MAGADLLCVYVQVLFQPFHFPGEICDYVKE
jgi:hypothetical protein